MSGPLSFDAVDSGGSNVSWSDDHLEGFGELLDASGRTLVAAGVSFRAIVRTVQPPNESFDLSPSDNDAVMVSALRADIPAAAIQVGAGLTDEDGFRYRVTRLHRSPNRQIVQLQCTVLNP